MLARLFQPIDHNDEVVLLMEQIRHLKCRVADRDKQIAALERKNELLRSLNEEMVVNCIDWERRIERFLGILDQIDDKEAEAHSLAQREHLGR